MQEATIKKEVSAITLQATKLIIKSDDDMRSATTVLSALNKQADTIKAFELKVTKPLNEALKAERARWKPLKDSIDAAVGAVRKAMITYQTEAKAKAEEEKEKIVARIGDGKGKLKITTAAEKLAEIEEPTSLVATDEGAVSFVTDYEIEISDVRQVPLEYLDISIRRAEVKRAVKAGTIIPGLVIKEIQVPKNYR